MVRVYYDSVKPYAKCCLGYQQKTIAPSWTNNLKPFILPLCDGYQGYVFIRYSIDRISKRYQLNLKYDLCPGVTLSAGAKTGASSQQIFTLIVLLSLYKLFCQHYSSFAKGRAWNITPQLKHTHLGILDFFCLAQVFKRAMTFCVLNTEICLNSPNYQ